MTPTHLADEIEALAKKAAGCDPDDHLGRAINHNILVLTMLNNLTAIVSALRERDALKAEVERLRGALEDVLNPLGHMRKASQAQGHGGRLLRACRLAERFAADAGDKRVWRAMGLTIRMAWETAMSPPDVRTFTLSMMKRDREGFYLERPRTKTQKQTQPIISDQLAEDLLAYEKALTAAGVEILKTAPLFRSKRGQPWDRDFLAHRFAELRRAAFGPDEKRQFQDLRRSANLEADLGGASAEDRARVMANALDRNPMLDATYTPATVAAGRKVRTAREAGRQLLDQELGRKTK